MFKLTKYELRRNIGAMFASVIVGLAEGLTVILGLFYWYEKVPQLALGMAVLFLIGIYAFYKVWLVSWNGLLALFGGAIIGGNNILLLIPLTVAKFKHSSYWNFIGVILILLAILIPTLFLDRKLE